MDGLLDYANIFTFWMNQLALFWEFLSFPIGEFVVSTIDDIIRIFEQVSNFNPLNIVFWEFIESAILGFLRTFGLLDLSVLGFFFAMMGVGFGFYFIITFIQWILKAIPIA